MKLFRILNFFVFLYVLGGTGPFSMAQTQNVEISVKAEVDNAFVTIGDKINFKVTVVHPQSIRIFSILTNDALKDFEVKESKSFSYEEKGVIHEGKNYIITNYELGEYVIRPVQVEYELSGRKKTAETNQLYVSVQSVGGAKDENADIRGIKGVLKMKPLLWPWFLLISLASATAAFLYWRARVRRKRLMPNIEEPALSAHDEAYQAIQRLQISDLLARGEIKLYFLTLSEIIRRFLERRFQIHALESTTREIMNLLRDHASIENRKVVETTLDICDFVKFAKYRPEAQEIVQANKAAREIVDRLKEVKLPVTDEPIKQE